jgi:hypothetical protein
MRLEVWNTLSIWEAQAFLAESTCRKTVRDLYRSEWVSPVIIRRLGWRWQPAELTLFPSISRFQPVLWAETARFCPICLGLGFHSIWFQLKALPQCPIHGCRIESRCMACGVKLPPYRLTNCGRAPAYHCVACKAAIAGAPLVADDVTEFFEQRKCVEDALAPLKRWFHRAQCRLAILDEHLRPKRTGRLVEGYRQRLLAGAVEVLAPYPARCASGLEHPVQLCSWRVQLARPASFGLPTRYGFLSAGMAQRVYQATLRALIQYASNLPQSADVPDRLVFCGDRSAELAGWQAERLALILLRCAFEQSQILDWKQDVAGAALRESALIAAISSNTLLRVTCRALIVAAYLGFCWLARYHICNGSLSREDLATAPDELFVSGRAEVGGLEYGVAIVPRHTLPESLFPRRIGRLSHAGNAAESCCD